MWSSSRSASQHIEAGHVVAGLGAVVFSSALATRCRGEASCSEAVDLDASVIAQHSEATPAALAKLWSSMPEQADVLAFQHENGPYGCFSNFCDQSDKPFKFIVPPEVCQLDLTLEERTHQCTFSEKAIMLCKAAAMGDRFHYDAISAASAPMEARRLGRSIRNFDQDLWTRCVCLVAYEIVYQKFKDTPEYREILLMTGDVLIAEAAWYDQNWGIGMRPHDPRVRRPAEWQGTNILGWALMKARARLRDDVL